VVSYERMDDLFASFIASLEAFLNIAGDDPFKAMGYLLFAGGYVSIILWLLIARVTVMVGLEVYKDARETAFAKKMKWVLLRISVPNVSEQTPKATENMFVQLAGAHSSISWAEEWRDGAFQASISMEVVCTEGQTSFYVRCVLGSRDLVEAAVYAQYPDAEIDLVEDYSRQAGPEHSRFPDPEWNMWGCEFVTVKEDAYSLKVYSDFEDKVSGEFKDPVAAYLEVLSRLGPGEHCWMQISLLPTDQNAFRKRSEPIIKKLRGEKVEVKKSLISEIAEFPFEIVKGVLSIFGINLSGEKKADKKDEPPKLMRLSPIERDILEATERKASKIGFECKIRFLYLAKKTAFSKARIAQGFIGAIKQTNTFHMQAIKPDFKKTGMSSAIWFFKDRRNDKRKSRLLEYYRSRDGAGVKRFFLSAEELATIWHFPILMQVKAPSLRQIVAKKSTAPMNLPFEVVDSSELE
jgi:hypothetical protein